MDRLEDAGRAANRLEEAKRLLERDNEASQDEEIGALFAVVGILIEEVRRIRARIDG